MFRITNTLSRMDPLLSRRERPQSIVDLCIHLLCEAWTLPHAALVSLQKDMQKLLDRAYQRSFDHSYDHLAHLLSQEGITDGRKGSDRRIEDGESVPNNQVNGAHPPFPSSTSPPPTTTFPSQSASSYSDLPSSRAEEGRSDRETQTLPNASFETTSACAITGKAIVLNPDGT